MSEPIAVQILKRAECPAEQGNPKHVVMQGGNDRNPTWDEYLVFQGPAFKPYLEVLRAEVEARGLVGTKGFPFANEHVFLYDDGVRISMTARAWADFMQSVVGKREGYDAY